MQIRNQYLKNRIGNSLQPQTTNLPSRQAGLPDFVIQAGNKQPARLRHSGGQTTNHKQYHFRDDNQRSASIAAIQPLPAAVTACL